MSYPEHHKRLVWIDVCNAPHVLFFEPVIAALVDRGYRILVTAQDFGQTLALLDQRKVAYTHIGGPTGRSHISKIWVTSLRSIRLMLYVRVARPSLLVSHGSRSAAIAARLLSIPAITIDDYEHSFTRLNNWLSRLLLFPSVIPLSKLVEAGIPAKKIRQYPGYKEEVYLSGLAGRDDQALVELGLSREDTVVLLRPPAATAHYHSVDTDAMFERVIRYLAAQSGVQILVLPRNSREREQLAARFRGKPQFIVLSAVFDNVSLLSSVDVMIGGGGTMNREAALLGVSTYSFFNSKKPAVDEALERSGRMRFLTNESDLRFIELTKRFRSGPSRRPQQDGLKFIVDTIERMVEGEDIP